MRREGGETGRCRWSARPSPPLSLPRAECFSRHLFPPGAYARPPTPQQRDRPCVCQIYRPGRARGPPPPGGGAGLRRFPPKSAVFVFFGFFRLSLWGLVEPTGSVVPARPQAKPVAVPPAGRAARKGGRHGPPHRAPARATRLRKKKAGARAPARANSGGDRPRPRAPRGRQARGPARPPAPPRWTADNRPRSPARVPGPRPPLFLPLPRSFSLSHLDPHPRGRVLERARARVDLHLPPVLIPDEGGRPAGRDLEDFRLQPGPVRRVRGRRPHPDQAARRHSRAAFFRRRIGRRHVGGPAAGATPATQGVGGGRGVRLCAWACVWASRGRHTEPGEASRRK